MYKLEKNEKEKDDYIEEIGHALENRPDLYCKAYMALQDRYQEEGRGEIPISEEKIQELEKDEEDYKKAILDEGIREMAMESLRKDHTTIDFTNPFGRSLLKSSIIELYRKK